MIKLPLLKSFFAIAIAFTLPLLTPFTGPSVAQPPVEKSPPEKSPTGKPVRPARTPPTIRFQPPPPPDPGEPDNRGQGGGSRGPCRQYEELTALVPIAHTGSPWGVTVSDRPTVWVYAPAGLAANVPMDFVLRDRQGNALYKTTFKSMALPAGVVRLPIPPQIKLQAHKSYKWSLAIYCDATEPDTPKVVRGRIERLELADPLKRELTAAPTPLQQAQIYADHGIWYDALTVLGMELAGNQSANPAVKTAWTELLTDQKLGGAAAVPIVPCCTLK